MFYVIELKRDVEIHPKDLGPRLRERIEQKLADEVEDKCDDKAGCIIAINSFSDFSAGHVLMGFGTVMFTVTFQCLVYKPEAGEVVDAVVQEITQNAIIASAGPMKIVINQANLPEDEGFHFEYRDGVRSFISSDELTRIQPGTEVRVRLIKAARTVADSRETFAAIGTIKDEWLGVLGS